MPNRLLIALCAAAASLYMEGAVSADLVKEGLWEISAQASIEGQPATTAPMVVRQCITNQTAQDLISQLTGGGACQISDFKQDGNRAHWNLACSGQVSVNGTGEVVMRNDGFSGVLNVTVGMSGQTVPMTQTFDAHWVGDCK
jgi:Protein of unknown function (DUF3617)